MRKVSIRIQIMLWYTLLTAILLAVSLPVLYGAMAGPCGGTRRRTSARRRASWLPTSSGRTGT